jgi:hypothetical protein
MADGSFFDIRVSDLDIMLPCRNRSQYFHVVCHFEEHRRFLVSLGTGSEILRFLTFVRNDKQG